MLRAKNTMERYREVFLPSLPRLSKQIPANRKWGKRLQSIAHLLCIICHGLIAVRRNTTKARRSPALSFTNRYTRPSEARLTSSMGSLAENTESPQIRIAGTIR